MIKAFISCIGDCVVVQRAVPEVLAWSGSYEVNGVSPGVQGMDDVVYADPVDCF